MGRRAKAFTQAERSENAKQKQKERRETPYGQVLIKAQRYTAYHTTHGRQGSSTPYIPNLLLDHARTPLPEHSSLFRQAVHSAQLLDETGLEMWDTGPPYPTGPPSNTPDEITHTKRLVEVMHGRRMRMQKEREPELNTLSKEALWDKYKSTMEAWRVATTFLESYDDGHRELAMARLWVKWLAREAHDYYNRYSL